MRVLVGGIIGAAASAAAWFFLEYVTGREMGWLVIVVGIITGLCTAAAAGASASESYVRGALAVALTMIAMIGGRAVYAKVIQNISIVSPLEAPAHHVDNATIEAPVKVAADEDATVQPIADQRTRTVPAHTGEARVKLRKPTLDNYKEMEVVWMAVAALCAYFTGKGSGKAAPLVTDETPENAAGTPA